PGTTTASTPLRSVSACHRLIGSAPARRTARCASTSSSVPGNVITPIFAVNLLDLQPYNFVVLDDGIGQQVGCNLLQVFCAHGIIDFDFKALALANIAYSVYTQASKRTDNSLSLRVEDFRLGHDIDNNTSHNSKPYCASFTACLQLPTLAVRHAKLLDGWVHALPIISPASILPRFMNAICQAFKPRDNFQLRLSKLPARHHFCCCWGYQTVIETGRLLLRTHSPLHLNKDFLFMSSSPKPASSARRLRTFALAAVASTSLTTIAVPAVQATPEGDNVVISEVFGGGGNSGAPLVNDFIELFNPTEEAIDLAGWNVEYFSASGGSGGTTALIGTIPAGGYFLIQQASGKNTSLTALPTPDASGTLNMSGTKGSVTLSSPAETIDVVGYGAAQINESSPTSQLSNSTSASRDALGSDTDNNA